MTPEFRAGERVVSVRCVCTECGKPAEGNYSWKDGSGEICDACERYDHQGATTITTIPELRGDVSVHGDRDY